ncbi:hypothetical protein BH20ACI2_BH20ACI2_22690 [soil metagenome]
MLRSTLTAVKTLGLFALMIAVVSISTAFAQAGSANVTGTVTDAQGAVVAGATVRLNNAAKGFTRTAMTNNSGQYSFSSVPADTYSVEIEAAGFKKLVRSNVVALVDRTTDANATLELGSITEVVNVSGGDLASIVNTQDASLGNNFVSQQILQLPLNARNVTNLLSLQAGVTPDGSVMGGRSDQANITLDGVDVNNQQQGFAFSPVLRVNPDSVDEFRVTTSNPDASKGRSSGAQISLITKSGTNQFHGALYEYHRNTVTSANNWFSNATGSYVATDTAVIQGIANAGDPRVPREKLLRNLFGGRLGGPIVKDRLFFFYNYEGLREARNASRVRLVPRASLAAGNVYFVDNTGQPWTVNTAAINSLTLNGAPVVDVNPLVPTLFAGAASRYPANDSTLGDGFNTGGFRFNAPLPAEQNAHTMRLDWNMTRDQAHTLSFRGNYQQDITSVAPYFPDTPPANTWSHPLGYSVAHTWLLNSRMTNRITFGASRLAFSDQGDSADPTITFRFVFQPVGFTRTFSRVNPTYNIADDFTWIKGNHTWQMGTNIRLIRNTRVNFARAFDNGITNPSAYASNASRVALDQYITAQTGSPRTVASAWSTSAQGALVALFGRLNGYGANFNFNADGSLQAANTGVRREFKTEEYDFYVQDSWKMRPNLTLTLGLRYGLSMPVYETQGFETAPNIVLDEYLKRRAAAADQGINYREPISVRLAGKVNGLDSMYPLDKNNLQPRVSVAWSPKFERGLMGKLFGNETESVIRAGFAITNDYFGQQLATQWDGGNTLGFSSSSTINVNTYNITTNPAPLYTGPSMTIRNLPNLVIPGSLTFPQTAPVRAPGLGKIEGSLDQNLVSPINYSWNVSYGRRLPGKIWVDAAYVARLARNLLASRDVMMVNNIRDPRSGMTFNEAATIVEQAIRAGTPFNQIPTVPFFDNMWAPGSIRSALAFTGIPAGLTNTQAAAWLRPNWAGDWGYMWQELSDYGLPNHFFQGQYDALSAHGTFATSDYHGATLSIRQRLSGVTWDLNYTFSKSIDDASGLQTSGAFGGGSFVLDAFNVRNNRSVSDFDIPHVLNFNGVWEIPIGRNRWVGGGMNKFLDAIIGGWQLSGVFRYDSGINQGASGHYEDGSGWQTNWNRRSYPVLLQPIRTGENYTAAAACNTASATAGCSLPNLFSDPDGAYASFRTPYPGETGTRNALRLPRLMNLDAGLAKSFKMPWEGHRATIRWDVFNVTNTPVFAGQAVTLVGETGSTPNANFGSTARANFGRFTTSRNPARVMQFAFRYDF